MTEDEPTIRAAVVATSFQTGIMPAVDGEKVLLVIHAHEPEEVALSIPPQIALDLGRSLVETAERVLAEDPGEPPIATI